MWPYREWSTCIGTGSLLWLFATSAILELVLAGDEERQVWYDAATRDIEARIRAASLSSGEAKGRGGRKSGEARGVVLFVGDGMGMSTLTAARILSGQRHGNTGEEAQLAWDRFPAVALARTYNMDAQVGESSACATALLCGVKANYETVGLDASGKFENCYSSVNARVSSVIDWAHERGKSTGLVTTTRVTHATPAALYAHASSRYWEDDAKVPPAARLSCKDIALQLLEDEPGRKINVVLGGGRRHFVPKVQMDPEETDKEGRRLDGRNLIEEWIRNHRGLAAKYVSSKEQLEGVDPRRIDHLLGLFAYSHMDFDVDRNTNGSGDPSLAEMTIKALRIVAKNPRGYFLFVEGGRIDHAHHYNNAYRALDETLAMEEAVRAVMKEVDLSDTLIVVTADHSHVLTLGGLATLRGNPIFGSDSKSSDLDGKPYTTLLYSNGPGHAEPRSVVREAGKDSIQTAGVPRAWATHGGEDVPVFAIGPLSTLLFSGSIDQSYIPHAISYAACLESRHANRCTPESAGGTPINVNETISSISCPSAEPNSAAISSDVMNDQVMVMNILIKMPKLNRVLISSIVSQVEELVSLSKEISSWLVKKVNLTRRFPATAPINVETTEMLKDYRGTAGEMYILLLELAYERIHFVLRLMVEFVEYHIRLESHEENYDEKFKSLIRVGSYARVTSTAKLLWCRLKVWPDFDEINSREYMRRMAFVGEYKNAIGYRLAIMTESKIALEKTVSVIRREIIDRQVKENTESNIDDHRENIVASPRRMTKSTQTTDEARDEETMRLKSSSVLLITPDDDPVMDMTREILSNKQKIDDLLRQNERLSRALVRISQHNGNSEIKSTN